MVWSGNSNLKKVPRASMLNLLQSSLSLVGSSPLDEVKLIQSDQKDQCEAVSAHTLRGIENFEKIQAFLKERALLSDEFAAKIRGLTKKTFGKKKEDENDRAFTYMQSFYGVIKETECLAAQHERIGDRIRKDVLKFVSDQIAEHRAARKACLADLQQIDHNLNASIESMCKQQKAYGKAFKEAEAAYLKYYKAEKNMEISRLDLEKAKNNAQMRSQLSEEAKQIYAAALGSANEAQHKHYTEYLPSILERLRKIDESRITDIKKALEMGIMAEVDVTPVIARCHDDMRGYVGSIDPAKDTTLVLESFRTGYVPRGPFEFEDLGRPETILNAGPNGEPADATLKRGVLGSGGRKDSKAVSRKQSMHQKLFGGSDKHKAESDYGSLPPQQRVRRLQQKIGEYQMAIEKNQQSRDGVLKMQAVYKENPKLGNPTDCDQQLKQYSKEIDSLNNQINHLRIHLDNANAEMQAQFGGNVPVPSSVAGSDTPPSVRSDSGSGHFAPPRPQPPHSQASQRTSYSEESVSSEGSRGHPTNGNAPTCKDEVYEECTIAALGTCTAVYAFEATTDGTINMTPGEQYLLIEKDEGDGWTRVRRMDSPLEGFVPTTYLECKYYPVD